MAQIGITPEVRAMALELANLGRRAEAALTVSPTEATLSLLLKDLKAKSATLEKLQQAIRATLAEAAKAERQEAKRRRSLQLKTA